MNNEGEGVIEETRFSFTRSWYGIVIELNIYSFDASIAPIFDTIRLREDETKEESLFLFIDIKNIYFSPLI